ncbi:MAG TPA: prepilin peptidase [Propionibacteriaceae bacterium]|nr:prepilin peptidase [Propionibacteriaceae bacterium]
MTADAWVGVALVTGAVAVSALLARFVVSRLPEPADGADKMRYVDLVTPGFLIGCALMAGAAASVGWLALSPALQPFWWVLATFGVVLTAVDARTTWLPLHLTRLAWAAMTAGSLLALLLGAGWFALLRAGAGAGVAGLLYLLFWRLSRGGFGFGDVRFAPLVGAATAAHSWSLLVTGLFAGSVLGAAYGGLRLVRRRAGPFPYAPAMLAGGYLACGIAALG